MKQQSIKTLLGAIFFLALFSIPCLSWAVGDTNNALIATSTANGGNPTAYGVGYADGGKVNFQYAPTSINTPVQQRTQAATNAGSFVPVPGVMNEFVINSDAAEKAKLLKLWANRACGPKAYTGGKFNTRTVELSNTEGDEDVDVLVNFSPLPGFIVNETETMPGSAFVMHHQDVNWNDKFTCLAVVNIDPKDNHQQLDHAVLENAAGAFGSSAVFGHYSKIVMVYTTGSARLRSGSTSDVETLGLTVSSSGAPGTSSFVQGAIGYGDTDGTVAHTDIPSLGLVVLAVDNVNGKRLQSYAQFEQQLTNAYIGQQVEIKKQMSGVTTSAEPVATQAAGSSQVK